MSFRCKFPERTSHSASTIYCRPCSPSTTSSIWLNPVSKNLFYDDVVGWLDKSEIRYVANAKFTGASGYDHLFQFSIPKSTQQPERILRTINRPTREQAQIAAFSWIDIREVRPEGARAYAILNDFGRKVSPNVLEAMQSYEVQPIVWSEREQVREELAA